MKPLVNYILESRRELEKRKSTSTKKSNAFQPGDIIKGKTVKDFLVTGEVQQYYPSSNRAVVKDFDTNKKFLVNCDTAVKIRKSFFKQRKELSPNELVKNETNNKIKKLYNEISKLQKLAAEYKMDMEQDPQVIQASQTGEDPGDIESVKKYDETTDKILDLYQQINDLKNSKLK